MLSSDSAKFITSVAKRSLTRIDKLKNQATTQFVDDEIIRRQKKLVIHWRCDDEHCINSRKCVWCFVDWEKLHYNMNHLQQSKWTKIMKRDDFNVTVERSSLELYLEFTQKQNLIDDNSKKFLQQLEKKEIKQKQNFFANDWFARLEKLREQKLKMNVKIWRIN